MATTVDDDRPLAIGTPQGEAEDLAPLADGSRPYHGVRIARVQPFCGMTLLG